MEERANIFHLSVSRVHLSIAGAIFLIFLAGYIVEVNASSTKAYALRDATYHHEELLQANDRLVAEIDRLRSLSSVMERKAFLDLVPVTSVAYVEGDSSNTLALK